MNQLGTFYGIGVGPGPAGLLPVASLHALQSCQVIYLPRAENSDQSIARQCLSGLNLPEDKFREIRFSMNPDRSRMEEYYAQLASDIAAELKDGRTVAYLTLGDTLTYSTYSYTLQALLKELPEVPRFTIPGVTSFSAAAAALDWPLGQGKERVLVLPCPENMDDLWNDIATHDVVVLMKIGRRLGPVLKLLQEKNIAEHCVLASRIGLPDEFLCNAVEKLDPDNGNLGYLSTMLIRRSPAGVVGT